MNNFLNVLKQAQDLKGRISELKQKLENVKFYAKDKTEQVEVVVSGKGILLDLNISTEFSSDSLSLRSKIKEAYDEAKFKADNYSKEEINKVTGSIPLPFDLKSLF